MEPQTNRPFNQQQNQEPNSGYAPNTNPAGPQPQNQWPAQQPAVPTQQPPANTWQSQPAPNPGVVMGGMAPQTPGAQPVTGTPQPFMTAGMPKKKPVLLIAIIAAVILIGGAAAFIFLSGNTSKQPTSNAGNNSPKGSTTVELSSLQGTTFVPGDMGGLTQSSSSSQSGLTSYQSADKNCKLSYGVLPQNSSYLGDTPEAISQTLASAVKAYGTATSPTQTDNLVLADSSSDSKQYELTTYTFTATVSGKQIAYYVSSAIFANGNRAIVSVVCGTNNSATTTTESVRNIAKNLMVTPQ